LALWVALVLPGGAGAQVSAEDSVTGTAFDGR
jgi:hypothetical protein